MKSLLYLSHRIPYPPDKGDKIRSYNLLRQLAETYKVYLATFIDDETDWQHTAALESMCEQALFVRLRLRLSRVLSLRGLLQGTSLTLPYYQSNEIRRWVRSLVNDRRLDVGIAFSSSMAQYLDELRSESIPSIIDFCDVDSDKWRQYGESKRWPASWVFSREARTLAREERRFHELSQASVLISDDEANVFRSIIDTGGDKVSTIMNGVDTAYYDPKLPFESPYDGSGPVAVFVGAMDYWPNVDAVTWFAEHILPGVLSLRPNLTFYIVGSKPADAVRRLAEQPNVVVTGRVDDVRPWVRFADCAIAPIRVARGVQNKVLEAMAMARPLLATSQALEGIGDVPDLDAINDPESWVNAVNLQLESSGTAARQDLRDYVKQHFSWEASASRLADLVESVSPSR